MGRTEDWSEFIQAPVDGEIVELAGKWKHGWIPLDATAVSAKMKGNTGGKKWWSGDGKAIGVPKQTRARKKVLTVKEVPSAKAQKRDKAPAAGASKAPAVVKTKPATAKLRDLEAEYDRVYNKKTGSRVARNNKLSDLSRQIRDLKAGKA